MTIRKWKAMLYDNRIWRRAEGELLMNSLGYIYDNRIESELLMNSLGYIANKIV